MEKTSRSIDEYIARQPAEIQKKLQEMRAIIHAAAPQAEERISYSMPAFFQNGILVYFAAFKDHLSFFPTGSGISAFAGEIKSYKTSKGTLQIPFDQPLPLVLLTRMVKFRVEENLGKANKK